MFNTNWNIYIKIFSGKNDMILEANKIGQK